MLFGSPSAFPSRLESVNAQHVPDQISLPGSLSDGSPMPSVADLVASYGYVALFLLIALESLGIPLPGETALVAAAALAARGQLDIRLVIAAAAAGAIVGGTAGYSLGRTGGIALVHRYGRRVGLNESKVARIHTFFERHGAKTVFIGRFIALLRSWASVLAGVAGMPFGRFMLLNVLGGVVWSALFGALGYWYVAGVRESSAPSETETALVSAGMARQRAEAAQA